MRLIKRVVAASVVAAVSFASPVFADAELDRLYKKLEQVEKMQNNVNYLRNQIEYQISERELMISDSKGEQVYPNQATSDLGGFGQNVDMPPVMSVGSSTPFNPDLKKLDKDSNEVPFEPATTKESLFEQYKKAQESLKKPENKKTIDAWVDMGSQTVEQVSKKTEPAKPVKTVESVSSSDIKSEEADIPDSEFTVGKYKSGKDFVIMTNPLVTDVPDGKIEVKEYFWIGCPHCYRFSPYLDKWDEKYRADDVVLKRIPAVLAPAWIPLSKAWVVGEVLGIEKEVEAALYRAIHVDNFDRTDVDMIKDVFAEIGVSEEKFDELWNSNDVMSKLKDYASDTQSAKLQAVPSMVVDGRYRMDSVTSGSEVEMLGITEELLNKIRND